MRIWWIASMATKCVPLYAARMKSSEELDRLISAAVARIPEWVRNELSSKDVVLRTRAEETLAFMIAGALADSAEDPPA